MLQRGEKVIAKHVKDNKAITLINQIVRSVKQDFKIAIDESNAYNYLYSSYNHKTVNHGGGGFVREDDIHTNSIESFWSTLKRGIIAIYHQVSTKYLQQYEQYVNEFCFRYNESKNVNVFESCWLNLLIKHIHLF